MRAAHLAALPKKDRFQSIYQAKLPFLLAAALDPRTKTRGMTEEERDCVLLSLPVWLARADAAFSQREAQKAAAARRGRGLRRPRAQGAPPRLEPPSRLWASSSDESLAGEASGSWETDFRAFQKKPRIKDRRLDVSEFWYRDDHKFGKIRRLGVLLSTIPPTQIASEQLFSHAGMIVTPKRASLLPGHIEKLVFCQKNLRLLNYEY
jgi:hypothetical protein